MKTYRKTGSPGLYNALPFSTLSVTVKNPQKGKTKVIETTILGQNLVRIRQERKLSQKEAAGQMEVSQAIYGGWERGTGNPDILNMQKAIAFLGYYPFPEPTTFSGRIKKFRQIHGLTYSEFGKLFNVSEATAWTWENEKYAPNEPLKTEICNLITEAFKKSFL